MLSVVPEAFVGHGSGCCCLGCQPRQFPPGSMSLAESMEGSPGITARTLNSTPTVPVRPQSSRPGALVKLYLDFDGEAPFVWQAGTDYLVRGPGSALFPSPVPAFSIDAVPGDFNEFELNAMDDIWAHVAEKYSPFDIDVTTIRPATFNDAEAVHIIIGGSKNDWYQKDAGGVAPLEGFTRSELSNEGFVFSADAINAGSLAINEGDRHFLAETVAHEAGHLFGLRHQSTFNVGGAVTEEYSSGNATTVPIMGASSVVRDKRGIWNSGPTTSLNSDGNPVATGPQSDLDILTRPGTNISYRVDDFGSFSSAGTLVVNPNSTIQTGSGVIERNGDQDAFRFTAAGPVLSIDVSQFKFPNNTFVAGMLAPTLELIPTSGAAPTTSLVVTNTSATITTSNATPGQTYILRVSAQGSAYGNLGQYNIFANVGTFATESDNTLYVQGYSSNNQINVGYESATNQIYLQNVVSGGTIVQRFARGSITRVVVNGQGGADVVTIQGSYTSLNIPVDVFGALGNDTLILEGTAGNDYQALNANGRFVSNAATGFYSSMQNIILTAYDGADTFEIYETGTFVSTTITGGNQDDVFNVGASPFAGTLVQGPVFINGNTGNDTLNLGRNNADSFFANITFSGDANAGGLGDRIVINDQAPAYNISYDVAPTFLIRDGANLPQTINYAGTEGIVINAGSGADTISIRTGVTTPLIANGNNGNDNFIVGGGNLTGTFPQTFNGGNGTDQITFNDSLSSIGRIWDVRNNEVIFGGLISLFTTGFESVGILAGNGADQITFAGSINQGLNIDAGGGADTFILGFQQSVTFFQPVSLVGGSQGTIFNINEAYVHFFTTLMMDGGDGFNSMNVNVPSVEFTLGEGYFTAGSGTAAFGFTNINTKTFNGNPSNNIYTIFSAGSSFGTYTINGNLGDDAFNLVPQPGGFTFRNLTLNGQQGTDTFTYNASALTTDQSYTVNTSNISISRGGVIIDTPSYTSMNSVAITSGSGNDIFNINSHSTAWPATINGGGGNDTYNVFGSAFGASAAAVSLTLADSAGFDTFNLNDQDLTSVSNATYQVNGNTLVRMGTSIPFSGIDVTNINSGAGIDTLELGTFASGILNFYAAEGNDTLTLPTNSGLIGGRVNFFGGGGTNNRITQSSNTKSTPMTLHIFQNTIGAFPGDNFFAPGGSVSFDSAQSIQLRMGSGVDTAFIEPNAVASISITGGTPATSPGDTINLALASAINPVISGTPSAGNVTSTNLRTVNYTGFENGTPTVDAIAPAVVVADINVNGVPPFARGAGNRQSVDIQFSEDVVLLLGAASIRLTNTTTGEVIPTSFIFQEYNAASRTASFTFPGYLFETLPNGNYTGQVLAGAVVDRFGNALAASTFNFFVLAGDANQDRKVDFSDLVILARNFGQSGRTFSQGDFDYDGAVNFSDLVILARGFGTSLASPLARIGNAGAGDDSSSGLLGRQSGKGKDILA